MKSPNYTRNAWWSKSSFISSIPKKIDFGDKRISPDNLNMTSIYLCQSFTWNMQDLREVQGEGLLWIQIRNQTTGRTQHDSSVGCQGNMSRNFQPWRPNCRRRRGEHNAQGTVDSDKTGKNERMLGGILASWQKKESLGNVWDVAADKGPSCVPQPHTQKAYTKTHRCLYLVILSFHLA